jgi:hypothetical protein
MNAHAQPFAVVSAVGFTAISRVAVMRGNDLMWRLNEKDATLKLHHGKLNLELMVRLSLGRLNEKIPHSLTS